jgi:hypothetical protein
MEVSPTVTATIYRIPTVCSVVICSRGVKSKHNEFTLFKGVDVKPVSTLTSCVKNFEWITFLSS